MQKEIQNNFYALTAEQTLAQLNPSPEGLTKAKVSALRLKHGLNKIPEEEQTPKIIIFLRQFRSLMVYILIIAAVISFVLERSVDFYVIIGIIIINAFIGYFQESRAEQAIRSLKKMIVLQARVLRDGEVLQIPALELVPGDIILLEEGDKIPADARLVELLDLRTIESALTGESLPSDKNLKALPEKTSLADRKNIVFLGTFVAAGTAKAVVTATGAETEIGKLASTIKEIPRRKSHFQEKTDALAKHTAIIAAFGAVLIFIVGFFVRKLPLADTFLFAIASLISGIPEGLPAILATVLAIGSYRMAKKNAVIRNRYATETLNIVDTILTDKTGTLTQNTMTVQEIILPGQKNVYVKGTDWEPKGSFHQNNEQIIPLENRHLAKLLHIGAYCNNSYLHYDEKEKKYKIVGDPTEAALVVLGEKAGLKKSALLESEPKIDEMPFNPHLKYRASLSVLKETNSKKEIYVIGAPESVLKHSSFMLKNGRKAKTTKQDLLIINKQINLLTNKAMRVIGVAYKEVSNNTEEVTEKNTEELIFVGAVGMTDPPRQEVPEAIKKAKEAGIRIIMVTGDHKNTAIAIAREIGILEKETKEKIAALTGAELEQLSEKEFEKAISEISVFARLTPRMKLKIAKTLQSKGKVVAVTGDGVNDAPALKQADIGISMGKIGTDVAREASEIILADDNFASIISAIEEGRTVFINTRQTSFFLVTTGFAEHATIITTMLLNLPLSLLPTQILWLNIITGGVTDVALSTEQAHHDVLQERPKKQNEQILNRDIVPYLILLTAIMLVLTLSVFNFFLEQSIEKARTAAFTVLSMTQIFNMLNMRSLKNSLFKLGFFTNKYVVGAFILSTALLVIAVYIPFFQSIFSFASITALEFITLAVLSSSVLLAGEIYKFYKRKNTTTPLK